jgi:3-hydroxyacyl-CoA dehydrogenase
MFDLRDVDRELAERHVKFAQNEASRIADIPSDTPLRPVHRVALIGAGTMGSGIAMSFADAGLPVTLIDTEPASLDRSLKRIRDHYDHNVKRGKLAAEEANKRVGLIQRGGELQAAFDADLVIEAVFEDMALKQDLFRRLDAIAKPGAILATNTSGLDIDAIAACTERPSDVVGAHFFSPAHVQKLLEVVRADSTSPDVVATLMALGRRMRKIAVLARVYPGFIGNALFRQYHREAHFLVEDSALPHEVDAALTRFGYAMGIFAVHDMAGNDVGYQTRKAQQATRTDDRRYTDLILKLVELGRLGQKTGKGWYRYESGDRTPIRDPEVEDFIIAESARMGMVRRPVDREEILQRCLFGMVNEGARLLEKGIAQRPSDIDIVYITGYGFPKAQGGPMFMADRIGLPRVLALIEAFHHRFGAWWEPSGLLRQLVSEGRSFGQWQASRVR